MAHSHGGDSDNVGDAWRVTITSGAFIVELCTDTRVNALYEEWVRMRGLVERDLVYGLVSKRLTDDAMERLQQKQHWNEAEATTLFVRRDLGLDRWATWIGPCLLEAFRIDRHNDRCPQDLRQFSMAVLMGHGAPRGRRPRAEGQDLERAVRWLYRAEVKRPTDTIHELAREYASLVGRDNDSRSVIKNGIKQVTALLDQVTDRVRIAPAERVS